MKKIGILLLILLVIATIVIAGCSTGEAYFKPIIKKVCNPATVANGNVATYPSCVITCKTGYTLSGKTCVAFKPIIKKVCNPATVANGKVASDCKIICKSGYTLQNGACVELVNACPEGILYTSEYVNCTVGCLSEVCPKSQFVGPHSFNFPAKDYQLNDWVITTNPMIVLKNSSVKIVVTTKDQTKIKNIQQIEITLYQMEQNPDTPGFGHVENFILYNDGTHGDLQTNDGYYTTEILTDNWYRTTGISAKVLFLDGSRETIDSTGVSFIVLGINPRETIIYETEHAVSVFPSRFSNSAKAYANMAENCYGLLVQHVGPFEFKLGKAYYNSVITNGYLETGGDINTVFAPEQFFSSNNPSAPEWQGCHPITAHELTHSIFSGTRMPRWGDEGLAEYTSQKVNSITYSSLVTRCEENGYYDPQSPNALTNFSAIAQSQWRGTREQFETAVCVYRYIEDEYGIGAIRNIYDQLKESKDYLSNQYCTPNYNFYDVLVRNTNTDLLNILESRFGIPRSEMSC